MIVRLKELDAQLAARLLESHLQLKNPNLKRKSTETDHTESEVCPRRSRGDKSNVESSQFFYRKTNQLSCYNGLRIGPITNRPTHSWGRSDVTEHD